MRIPCENPRTSAKQGEFAAFGAAGGISSSFGRTGEAAPTQVQVCAQDLSTPLQSAQTPQIAALDREEVESTAVPIPSGNPVVKTRLSTNPAEEHVVAEGEKYMRDRPLSPKCWSYHLANYVSTN